MRPHPACFCASLLLAAACSPSQETHVRVVDPSAVSLEDPAAAGDKVVLAASADPARARLARSYGAGDVHAVRDGAGGIALQCSTCAAVSPTPILTADGAATTYGDPRNTVIPDGDRLRIRVAYLYKDLATGNLHEVGGTPRLNVLELVTPKSNVEAVRSTKSSTTAGGVALMLAGVAVGALGSYALAARGSADPSQRGLLLAGGASGLVIGGGMAIGGAALVAPAFSRTEGGPAPGQ